MYAGFNVKVNLSEDEAFWRFHEIGKSIYSKQVNEINTNLKSFVFHDKSFDGSKIQEEWFPQIEADVFISHSHKNEDLAISLSGWLFKRFGITSFIDSCLWGYSNNLLQELDNTFSWTDHTKQIYSYEKVNFSSSHIHMMLSTALSMMIDKTECLFFLNTPDSLESFEKIDKTKSPWIYSEIAISKLLRINVPERFKRKILNENETFSNAEGEPEELTIRYNLDLSHLTKLDFNQLFYQWGKIKYEDKYKALNALYDFSVLNQ